MRVPSTGWWRGRRHGRRSPGSGVSIRQAGREARGREGEGSGSGVSRTQAGGEGSGREGEGPGSCISGTGTGEGVRRVFAGNWGCAAATDSCCPGLQTSEGPIFPEFNTPAAAPVQTGFRTFSNVSSPAGSPVSAMKRLAATPHAALMLPKKSLIQRLCQMAGILQTCHSY